MSDKNDRVIDVTMENIQEVVEMSKTRPVIIDFWAEWCGPCRALMPRLEKAVLERDAVLAKINVDQQPELFAAFNITDEAGNKIRSIPLVVMMVNNQLVGGFVGNQPDSAIKAFLDAHTKPASAPKTKGAKRTLRPDS